MILGPIGGNSGFDGPFLIIQLVLLISFCLGLMFSSRLPQGSMGAVVLISLIGELGVPLFWYLAYPPAHAIEGVGRLFFLIPFFLLNTVCSLILILKLRKRRSKVAIS